ncbi:MULE domain-containing protein, partial [Aphis craccivora]
MILNDGDVFIDHRKAQDDICEKPSKLLHSELKNNDTDTLTRYDCTLIKKNIHHARKNILPNIPQSYDEVHK